MKGPALVLSTVNAPYSKKLDAQTLAHCLLDLAAAKQNPGHVSSFFGEVEPALQLEFAQLFSITKAQLIASAKAFAAYAGESYPLAMLRQNRKLAYRIEEMKVEEIERIAANKMDERHSGLNTLMDD